MTQVYLTTSFFIVGCGSGIWFSILRDLVHPRTSTDVSRAAANGYITVILSVALTAAVVGSLAYKWFVPTGHNGPRPLAITVVSGLLGGTAFVGLLARTSITGLCVSVALAMIIAAHFSLHTLRKVSRPIATICEMLTVLLLAIIGGAGAGFLEIAAVSWDSPTAMYIRGSMGAAMGGVSLAILGPTLYYFVLPRPVSLIACIRPTASTFWTSVVAAWILGPAAWTFSIVAAILFCVRERRASKWQLIRS